jgi:hypothetical protein
MHRGSLFLFFIAWVGICIAACPQADLTNDCKVTLDDLVVFSEQWLELDECEGESPCANFDGTERIDLADFVLLARDWQVTGIPLVINEFMASNSSATGISDPQNQYEDWIEIYNFGPDPIDLGGMYLTDRLSNPKKWQIPSNFSDQTTVPAKGFLVFWADEDTEDGPLHADFKLSADGEEIGLFDVDGLTAVDTLTFGSQSTGISYGRFPDAGRNWRFFGVPTPGIANTGGYLGMVEEVEFSREHGFYADPFSLTLACSTTGVSIYYTTNGKPPIVDEAPSADAVLYTAPFSINGTRCIRAAAIKNGWKPSETMTQTYLFLADIKTQSSAAPGPGWPTGPVDGVDGAPQMIDYGMDPDVVNDPRYAGQIDEALLAIPSISLVTDLANLFDPETGIYVNAKNDGRGWERPASVELINPDGSKGFQIDAGLRIRGGWSRHAHNPKHAFRLFFRSEYGRSSLSYPMFGDEGVDTFDRIDLRTAQNYSWSFYGDPKNTMLREVFARDIQGQMGQPYTRSRYYHLYINGHYWGLFQTQERSEARYAASYYGGDVEDYDAVKVEGFPTSDYRIGATDGNTDAYYALWQAATAGFATDATYYAVQGLTPDGTHDPAGTKLVDMDNLIDYMIGIYYSGDKDSPISSFRSNTRPNNMWAIFNRKNPDGFKFLRHDAEHSLDTGENNRTGPYDNWDLQQFNRFTPQWLSQKLMDHPEYVTRFADRVYKHFFNGGVLEAANATDVIMARKAQIDKAIIAESARWGDAKSSTPRTRDDHWVPAVNHIVNNYIPTRAATVLGQLRAKGWYPSIDPPIMSQQGGAISGSYALSMTNPNGSGTIYYTTDGSDPRQPIQNSGPVSDIVLAAETAPRQVLVPTAPNRVPTGTVRAEIWTGIQGTAVSDLTGNERYPNSPDIQEAWTSFQMPVINWAEYYGTRVRALVYPPTTGNYTFWIASDDSSELWLSTNASSANANRVAWVPGWTNQNQWYNYTEQQSAARYLQAGQAYYIEALQKEHGGGDNLSVAWSGPGISGPTIIAGQYLSPPDAVWTELGYSPTGWISGSGAVGYENRPGDPINYSSLISSGIDVKAQMNNINTSCYIRIPFQYGGQTMTQLVLRIRYDDGFVAFINGREAARDRVNTTNPLDWNTAAAGGRPDSEAMTLTDIDITPMIPHLRIGTNILAIQGLNDGLYSSDFLLSASLVGKMKSPGEPSANAIAYTGPVTLTTTTGVKARVFTGSQWSALNHAVFAEGPVAESLRITELMYHPADPNTEYVELKNISASPINLNLVKFTKGIQFTFGDVTLAAGQHILVVENIDEFEAKYGTGYPVAGQYTGALDNGGERIRLEDAIGRTILDFQYKDGWRSITDGDGYSLTIINPADPDPNTWSYKDSWRSSAYVGGSPGSDDSGIIPNPGDIVINEVLAHSHAEAPDWIELYNTTAAPIDISGWYLSDTKSAPMKYRFAPGTVIAGHGYLVVTETSNFGSTASDPGKLVGFALSENGESVCLASALDAGGALTGYRRSEDFGASATGVPFGRYYKSSTDTYDFVPMSSATPGGANAYPKVGPIVFSEIMYHPDWPAGGAYPNDAYEYIELHNPTASAVTLYDAVEGLPWKFTAGIDYTFPAPPHAVTIPASGRILVVKNPTAFRWRYPSVPTGIIYGPYDGQLANDGEPVELSMPGDVDGAGKRHYISAERVSYSDGSQPGQNPYRPDLWPQAADGQGKSLGRIGAALYSSDPANWQAVTPSPGS